MVIGLDFFLFSLETFQIIKNTRNSTGLQLILIELSGERSGLFWEYVRIYGMSNQDPKQMYGASVFLNKGDKNIVPYYDILYANQNFEP